jgi:hypothetical protein
VDRDTGQILKVGDTGNSATENRFPAYQRWAQAEAAAWAEKYGWQPRNLDIYYVRSPDTATRSGRDIAHDLEGRWRADLEKAGERLPWDWKTKVNPKESLLPPEFGGKKTSPPLSSRTPFCR